MIFRQQMGECGFGLCSTRKNSDALLRTCVMIGIKPGFTQDMINTPRNCGRWINKLNLPRREAFELFAQQWIMRASKHDMIRAPTVFLDKARCNLFGDGDVIDQLTMHEGFCNRGEAFAANQSYIAMGGIIADEIARIIPRHCARCCKHGNKMRARLFSCRLDCRHCAHEGNVRKGRAQIWQHKCGGCVASDHHNVGLIGEDHALDHARNARNQIIRLQSPIGENRIIGDIDVARAWTHLRHLAEDGQSPKAGIEDENRRFFAHGSSE